MCFSTIITNFVTIFKKCFMYNEIISKKSKIAVIGLGYVGLPLAVEFAKTTSVIGFDINARNVKLIGEGIDPCSELKSEAFKNLDIIYTTNLEEIREAKFYIVAVPTPVDKYNRPDLTPLISATRSVAKVLKKGDYVVYESTVYPGCTEDDCVPVLEELSGLVFRKDFKVGYSPERINPGDEVHTLTNTVKIVSGCDEVSLEEIAKTYEIVIRAGVHRAASIKVAEAAKVIENTQRDVNIALMNELSIIFGRIGINTYDVLEAAGTKWNFLKFYPGLVGGHCIGVDPYYLVHKAAELNYHPQVIQSGRFVNDSMGAYIAKQTVKKILAANVSLETARVLIMGFTFKENVADTRNTKVADIIRELYTYNVDTDIIDPKASAEHVEKEYGITLAKKPSGKYNAVIIAVSHKEYLHLNEEDFEKLLTKNGIVIDIKGVYKDKISNLRYWSL